MSEWATGESDAIAQWDYKTAANVAYHKVWRQTQSVFDENGKPDGNGQANWGNVYYATNRVAGLTTRSGQDTSVRDQFKQRGQLDNSVDTQFRAVSDRWPVFAFAKDLGDVGSHPSSTLFTIGLLQNPAIQFLGAQGITALPALWASYFHTEESAVSSTFSLALSSHDCITY